MQTRAEHRITHTSCVFLSNPAHLPRHMSLLLLCTSCALFATHRYPDLFEMYKRAVASFWTCDEVDLSTDHWDWDRLTGGSLCLIAGASFLQLLAIVQGCKRAHICTACQAGRSFKSCVCRW